jgi:2-(1,2-epoxy-1,2-dihydrophenyl)acetyl-CoA isomerase
MTYEHILFEIADDIATLTINRPHLLNALSQHSLAEMTHAVDRVRDEGARVLLIAGAGRAFCSGADLSPSGGSEGSRHDMGRGLELGFNPLLERLARLPVPIVTAINGAAAGGGCGYALAGDIVIAGTSAYFLQPFANIGLVPDVGATWLLPRLIGRARATQMMMLGERIPAVTALEWGMIYQVVADDALMDTARAMAARLAAGPTIAYALMREGIARAATQSLSESLMMERVNQRTAGTTADHAEGVTAFLEKRKPVFRGA